MQSNDNTPNNNPRVLRFNDIHAITGLSRTSIWRRVRSGDFPQPISLGGSSVGWLSDEVTDWLKSRPRVRYLP